MLNRQIKSQLLAALNRGKSILLLGPRQTGKTTLVKSLVHHRYINLMDHSLRHHYEQSPDTLIAEIRALAKTIPYPLVLIDEIQRCPALMDSIQLLIDDKAAQFIITGSSPRKLRRYSELNLLPGRVVSLFLSPLLTSEMPSYFSLKHQLEYGSLPSIALTENDRDKEQDLISYSSIYLEEEIRAESLVRKLAPFARFLQLAAIESGKISNFNKLSTQIGVSHNTIKEYYQILEDCLIAIRVDPYLQTHSRRRLSKSPQYLYFDLGVRRACAKEGAPLPDKILSQLFEQWVALTAWRWQHYFSPMEKLYFWRDHNGPEVDWVIALNRRLLPIEVKWTENPTQQDARHLNLFISEYPEAKQGVIVCRAPYKKQINEQVIAIPWQEWENFLEESSSKGS